MAVCDETRYAEAGDAIRHFSSNVIRIRALAIAQGFAVLAGAALLTKEGLGVLSVLLAGFGILMTRVLSKYHDNYLNFLFTCFRSAAKLEDGDGTWSLCLKAREEFLGDKSDRIFIERGPFYLMYTALATVALYSLVISFLG